jgi:hypothetical protein
MILYLKSVYSDYTELTDRQFGDFETRIHENLKTETIC